MSCAAIRLSKRELVVLKFQLIAHIHAEGEKSDGNFGNDAGVLILDIGVIAPDIDDGAEHSLLQYREIANQCVHWFAMTEVYQNRPRCRGRSFVLSGSLKTRN